MMMMRCIVVCRICFFVIFFFKCRSCVVNAKPLQSAVGRYLHRKMMIITVLLIKKTLTTYLIIGTLCRSHQFHFSFFHAFHIHGVQNEYNAISASKKNNLGNV